MVGAVAIVVVGVAYTATHLNLSRFDNELRFRGQAHDDLTAVLSDPKVQAGLRCGPLTGPNHKIVPDSRWIASLGDGQVGARARELPRRPRRPAADQGRRDRRHLAASRSSSTPGPTPPTTPASRSLRRASSASRPRGSTPRMSAADRRAGAVRLLRPAARGRRSSASSRVACPADRRLQDRPAVRLQRRREQPLRPARDRDVRAQPNPDYFINPPAFTYVVHALFARALGHRPGDVGGAFAADPTTAFALARAASAFLGALAVALTAIAGARLFDDRRVGVLAGALLAVAFLPTHYSHFALNDAPTLAPLAAALIGIAGIYRTGRTREYVLAGLGLGVAIATKYTAGILLVTLIAAAFASPVAHARVRNLAFAVALCAPASWPPTRTRCSTTGVPRGPGEADRDRGRGRRQARAGQHQRVDLLPDDVHLGPGLAAVAVRARRRRRRCSPATGGSRCCSRPRRSCCSSTSASNRASSRAGCCRSTRSSACSRPTA